MVAIVLGIITYNRSQYLKNLLASFISTYNVSYHYTIIIADDGSTDDTMVIINNFIREYESTFEIVFIQNNKGYIAQQSNSILYEASKRNFDCGFMANDDIEFLEKGWDTSYYDSVIKTGFDHLVYFNKLYACKSGSQFKMHKKKIRVTENVCICSKICVLYCMGCFWTFTKKMINTIGYFNTSIFYGSGYSHIEYTLRACRANFNNEKYLYDVENNKIKVFCPKNDINYITVKDGMNVAKNKQALLDTFANKNPIYFNPFT